MLGGLHIEMALWNVGGLLESSGWETALNEAVVASVVMLGGLHIEMALWNVGGQGGKQLLMKLLLLLL